MLITSGSQRTNGDRSVGTIYDCFVTPVAHNSTQSGTAVGGVNHLTCVQSYLTKVYFLGWEFLAGNFC